MIFTCIHGRTAASSQSVECLDCEELSALRELEAWERRSGVCDSPCEHHVCRRLRVIDEVRRRKGIGAIGHPETREIVLPKWDHRFDCECGECLRRRP